MCLYLKKSPGNISLEILNLLTSVILFQFNQTLPMNRFKNFVEWNAFGVCSAIGNRMGIATSKIRQYFMYTSLLTMGSPIILYMILAFWKNMRRYIWAAKRNPWYYL